jgi:hypothetical protein
VHIDVGRARITANADGGLLVTTTAERLTPCVDVATGLRGAVVAHPCPCGSDDPRVRVVRAAG